VSAHYALFADSSDLTAGFTGTVSTGTELTFPNGTVGPQPWHASTAPDQPTGSVASVSFPAGYSNLVWTNDAKLLFVAAAPSGDEAGLFSWWQANG
jgi:hypothetical protein